LVWAYDPDFAGLYIEDKPRDLSLPVPTVASGEPAPISLVNSLPEEVPR
jgi:hypothetical protein